ncbi:GHH signature containing HNH/Endo VII superfamily nuclease toxin 2 [Pseudomonas flavescens]|uniref:GHH signature containing HNH/Endo VII superfamily nuclease toxin 2 n=1 Tax=Phytopseudomonas flavescens TaxID=29435 RepID=A0A1G8AMY3_9GAMM|nr:PAAR-like domain-containing protein [Pseudomonas flavescens]SDH22277.1 GHH signature containing HNH/Endo VII superfamily nuclease toxin 2 [Pseudomonas flavescens]
MANEVYANNREISCKSASGKSIAAFPDVCFTPPQTPPMPMGIPIPYPNTGLSSDTTKGTRTIRITRKEVMLKNKSYYKTSYGDEPGCAPKKGILTGKIKGKVYFTSWSMDVKFEGKNVVRHMDLTTHNHGSMPGNTPPWPYLDKNAMGGGEGPCKEDVAKEKDACAAYIPYGDQDPCPPTTELARVKKLRSLAAKGSPARDQANAKVKSAYEKLATKNQANKCLQARRCRLVPYKPKGRGKNRQPGCCPGQTGHHLIEASAFLEPGTRKEGGSLRAQFANSKYDLDQAPCVCAEGPDNTTATHGLMHTYQGVRAKKLAPDGVWTLRQATECGAASVNMVFQGGCNEKCLQAQLHAYHGNADVGVGPATKIPSSPSGKTESTVAEKAWQQYDKGKRILENPGDISR